MILLLIVVLLFLALTGGYGNLHNGIKIPKYRPVRDKFGRTQRDHHGNLIVEIYKYET